MSWLTGQLNDARIRQAQTPPKSMVDDMVAHGYTPPSYIEPGKLIRFAAQNKKSTNKSAWCIIFDDGTAGMYGDFVSGAEHYWRTDGKSTSELSPEDIAAIERAKEARKKEVENGYKRGAALAKKHWENASQDGTSEHKYIIKKQITPYICRVDDNGKLIIPIINIDGHVINAQRIDTDGNKRFTYEAMVDGGFIPVATTDDKQIIIITEGYATAATIADHNSGALVVAALNTGNLQKVARAMRDKYPSARIIIAADDDRNTDGNPGLTAAHNAAQEVGAEVVSPDWRNDSPSDATDFNDLWIAHHDPELLQIVRERSPDLALLLADDDEEFERIIKQEWLYDDAIPSASVGIMYGPSGTGKSFVALDLAMCIATGKPWNGFEHGTGKQSSVIYISAEGGRGMRIRKRGWEDKRGIRVPSVRIMPKPYMLNEPGGFSALVQLIRGLKRETGDTVSAVVVDTLAQCNSGDENVAKDATALTRACTAIAQECGCSVIMVHHTGKDAGKGARGSSAFLGNVDFEISLTGGVDTTVRIECIKQKDIEKFNDLSVSFDTITITGATDYKGRPVKTLVARAASLGDQIKAASRLGPDEADLVRAYHEMGVTGFVQSAELQRNYYIMPRIATRSLKAKRAAMRDAIIMLKTRGILTEIDGSISITADRQDE